MLLIVLADARRRCFWCWFYLAFRMLYECYILGCSRPLLAHALWTRAGREGEKQGWLISSSLIGSLNGIMKLTNYSRQVNITSANPQIIPTLAWSDFTRMYAKRGDDNNKNPLKIYSPYT